MDPGRSVRQATAEEILGSLAGYCLAINDSGD
jgi:hypothetical protein